MVKKERLSVMIVVFLIFAMTLPSIWAGGMVHVSQRDLWEIFDYEQQSCVINHIDGVQYMLLSVSLGEDLKGREAVWIFPVPTGPDNVEISLIEEFPEFFGQDVMHLSYERFFDMFTTIRLSQVYTLPMIFVSDVFKLSKGDSQQTDLMTDQSVRKTGLTTELVSAKDSLSLIDYLDSNDLKLPEDSVSMLEGYADKEGKEYSFVISWISEQDNHENIELSDHISIFVSFPTEKMYYPLKPASLYSERRVLITRPITLYILGYTEPELYEWFSSYTSVDYYVQDTLGIPQSLAYLFTGYEKEPSQYYSRHGPEDGFTVSDISYTRIRIDAVPHHHSSDLWMSPKAPSDVRIADHIINSYALYAIIILLACSSLASVFSAMIIFRRKDVPKLTFLAFGFWNMLSIIAFAAAACTNKTLRKLSEPEEADKDDEKEGNDTKKTDQKEEGERSDDKEKKSYNSHTLSITKSAEGKVSNLKILMHTLAIASVVPIIFFMFFVTPFSNLGMNIITVTLITLVVLYMISAALLAPLVWSFHRNRKILMFIILFSALFIALTILMQITLSLMLLAIF